MKSILNTARESHMSGVRAACLLTACIASSFCIRANAATIAVTYGFTGGPVGPEVMVGTTLIVDHLSTGSMLSSSPNLNALWNPFTLLSHDVVDFAALTLNGASTITFADGSTLFGHQFVDFANPLGPETLTFTGGTGEFAGATGLLSGGSVLLANGFSVSGTGTINAPAIPEPASMALLMGGLAVIGFRQSMVKRSPYKRTNPATADSL